MPDPHVENSSHANLDMFYLDVLRRNRRRLDTQVAPGGEPIRLNASMLGRFANTFLHVARPAEIDRGGHVRGNVHGDPTEPDKTGRTDVFNYSLDGWVTLAVADATVYRLCRDILLRTSGRAQQDTLALVRTPRCSPTNARRRPLSASPPGLAELLEW